MAEERPQVPSPDPAPAPEEGRDPRPMTHGQQRRRQRSVFQYVAILFGAAFLLLLVTFLMERRQYEQIQEENQEQIDDLRQSVSAVQSLEELYSENAALREQVDELETQLEQSQEQAGNLAQTNEALSLQLERTGQAMDWFWQIDEAYVRGRYSLCRDLMENLEEAGLAVYLPRESITDNGRYSPYDRYQEIRDALY